MVFALRSVSGRRPSAWENDASSSPIAAAVVFAFVTRSARSSRRAASARTVRDDVCRNAENVSWSRTTSSTSARDDDSAGSRYFAAWLACAPRPTYQRALPWMTCCSAARVLGSNVLKSWSRSTIDVVASVPSSASDGSGGRLLAPGVSAM